MIEQLPRWQNPHIRDAEFDAAGRKLPQPVNLALLLRAIPGLAARFRRIPERAIESWSTDELSGYALVSCPCGESVVARRGSLTKCGGCERYYASAEQIDAVFVTYGEMEDPAGSDRTQT